MAALQSKVRLAELVATLSLGTDLGLGQPMEHVLRQCLLALNLSRHLDFSEADRAVLYYSGLLAWVGCHVDAYEQAKWFGDDISLKAGSYQEPHAISYLLTHIGFGKPLFERMKVGLAFIGEGRKDLEIMLRNHWLATDTLAMRLGLGDDVRASLAQSFERWDGQQAPIGLKGPQIHTTSRLLCLTDVVEVFHRLGGVDAAIAVAKQRSGSQFDPALVDVFCSSAHQAFEEIGTEGSWISIMAAEPLIERWIAAEQVDSVLEAIADFADLKSPYTLGHSRGVADIAARAAAVLGFPEADVVAVRRAALLHDIGRLGVSNGIWDKRDRLTQAEMERVRLHPYLTERMLAFSPVLAPLGAIAVQHHERLDGSGYPQGISGAAITPAGRILAASDVYHAMTELRPHRPALSPENAAMELRAEVVAGRLDPDAVEAVLKSAGHNLRIRREWPAGLTNREVEVLRLVARGYSTKAIAEQLVISQKTASNHIEHIYTRIGVSNRATASIFAMQHGLMLGT